MDAIDTEYKALCLTEARIKTERRVMQALILGSSALMYGTFMFVLAALMGWV
jgi:hypothetical protein